MKVLVVLVVVMLCSCGYNIVDVDEVNRNMIELAEQSYFEGQKDFLNKDVRITVLESGCWVWVKSPWNSGKDPVWTPKICDSARAPEEKK